MALLSPHTFFTHVPAPGELVGGLAVQPPEHGAVHVGGVDLHGPEHLAGGGEGEAVADLEALADEAAALQPSVQEHGAVFAELVAQVGVVGHPGQLLAVQLEVHQVLQPGLLADHEYILGFSLHRIRVTGEFQIVLESKRSC